MDTSPRPTPAFRAVLCATDNSASGVAARRQAAWIAGDEHAVEFIPLRAITMAARDELLRRCAGRDLLVVGADANAHALVRHLTIPVLFARWCQTGNDVTDSILVAVDQRGDAARAAELAGRLARRHGGSVSLVAVPAAAHELRRALATAGRLVLQTTGSTPRIVGDIASAWSAVPRAVTACQASLVVLGMGDDDSDREAASDIARFAGCSVLIVPAPLPARPRRFEPARARQHATRRGIPLSGLDPSWSPTETTAVRHGTTGTAAGPTLHDPQDPPSSDGAIPTRNAAFCRWQARAGV